VLSVDFDAEHVPSAPGKPRPTGSAARGGAAP